MANKAKRLFNFENADNKVYSIDINNNYTHYDYPDVDSVIEFVQNSIDGIQKTINIQKDSSIAETGVGKLDIASANIFTSTTEPHFYKVETSDTTLYNGILYNGTVPFKNVTDDSLIRIQKDAVIYYAGGVAYCFTGEGIYSLLWDDTEKKGWVTKVKMDNESYYIYEKQDSLPNVTVTAGDFTWNATERTLTATGAANTTKTATIKFNEAVDGVYFSLSNNSGTGRMGILSAKVNNEDYYIGLLQGLGTEYTQWYMQKDDVLTITYKGDSTSTANETFVFKIEHWQKSAQTTSVASYTNYAVGNSELNEQMTTGRMQTDISNLQYDVRNIPRKVVMYDLTNPTIVIENNTEYRFTDRLDELSIGTNANLVLNERLEALVTFQTSVTNFEFSNVNKLIPGSPTILFIGDDTAGFDFSPKKDITYEILFRWNGQFVSGQVKKIGWSV